MFVNGRHTHTALLAGMKRVLTTAPPGFLLMFFTLLSSNVSAQTPPVEHWPIEPWTVSTSILDSELASGYGRAEAAMQGFPGDGTEWGPGVYGRALSLDGATQYIQHTAVLPKSSGTIGHWLRPSVSSNHMIALYESDYAGVDSPDYNGFGSAGAALEIHTGTRDGNFLAIWQDGAPSTIRSVSGGNVVVNKWSHVALTWTIPGQMTLYVDCVPVASTPMDASFEGRTPTQHFFGRPSQNASRNWFGSVDEVKIWSDAFSAEEVRAHFCPSTIGGGQVLRAPTPEPDAWFGYSAAMAGSWLLVRSPVIGQAHWYRLQGDTTFEYHSSTSSAASYFLRQKGRSVDISALTSAIAHQGSVKLLQFGQSVPDQWGLVTSVTPEFDDPGDFGITVALSNDLLAVGSSRSTGGAAYVFERNQDGPNSWGRVLYRATSNLKRFGQLVDVENDLLAVYSEGGNSGPPFGSSVYLFRRNLGGANAWGEEAKLDGVGSTIYSMALRGNRLALSSVGNNGRGIVAIHQKDVGGANQWGVEHYFYASDADWLDELGYELTWLDDQTIAAVARGSNKEHQPIYLFKLGGDQIKPQYAILLQRVFDPITENSASMGRSLAGNADIVVAGAPFTGTALAGPEPAFPVDSGRIHIFVTNKLFSDGFESQD